MRFDSSAASTSHSDERSQDGDEDYLRFGFTNSRGQETNYLSLTTSTLTGMALSQQTEIATIEKKIKDGAPEKLHKKLLAKLDDPEDDDLEKTVRSTGPAQLGA